jgi:kinesin family member 5
MKPSAGNGKTSIVITIGPDKRNVEETISSILFGQRAMKVVSTIRKNEDIDYHALSIKLQVCDIPDHPI